ncbi:hypothetical protein G7054_g13751 [Neopestalotiopsis clavispora]|nr:hypothetical protein G7054_g13751 [Neopestalotiopsis clavispora]
MHRDKSLYGEDVDVFRPERWLESSEGAADKERLRAMRRTNDLMFGHGKYTCLGKPVAMIEIHKTVFEVSRLLSETFTGRLPFFFFTDMKTNVQLVRNFDMGLINPANPWKSASLLGLWVISDMYVHATRRTPVGP